MKYENQYLGRENVSSLLWKLSLPAVAAQLINMLYNIVDRIYIGHMAVDGDLALTGVGICLPIILLISAFAYLVSAGGAPRASIAMGRGDMGESERIMGSCLALQVILSLGLTAVLLLWSRELLLAFGGSENTIDYGVSYLNTYAVGTIFVQLTLGMNAYITAQGFAKTSMCTVLIGAVCNIILDPVFIFGLNMGVGGAALATVLSQAISCCWVMSFLCGKKTFWRIRIENLHFNWKLLVPCLALGMSPFIMQASESVVFVCFHASLLKYGGDVAVGAMTILTSVMQFALLPLQGLGQGAQPVTSYNYGARNVQRVKEAVFLLLKISIAYAAVLWLLVLSLPELFAGMFTPDPELLAFSSQVLPVYCGAMVIFGVQTACQLTFVAIGYAGSSILVAVVRKFVLLLPLIYLIPNLVENKTLGVYMAEPVADVLAVIFTGVLFFVQFRKALNTMNNHQKGSI